MSAAASVSLVILVIPTVFAVVTIVVIVSVVLVMLMVFIVFVVFVVFAVTMAVVIVVPHVPVMVVTIVVAMVGVTCPDGDIFRVVHGAAEPVVTHARDGPAVVAAYRHFADHGAMHNDGRRRVIYRRGRRDITAMAMSVHVAIPHRCGRRVHGHAKRIGGGFFCTESETEHERGAGNYRLCNFQLHSGSPQDALFTSATSSKSLLGNRTRARERYSFQ